MGFLSYVLGPKLYMEYGTFQKMYESGGMERFSDQVLTTLSLMWNIGYYSSPLILPFLYRRGYFVPEYLPSFTKFSTSVGIIVVLSLCMRGFGRSQSASYRKLVKALELAKSPKTVEDGKRAYRLFDFDFRFWHVDFDVKTVLEESNNKAISVSRDDNSYVGITTYPCSLLAYLAIHTFGIRMIYPGSIKLLQSYMGPMLIAGRAKLIEDENGRRYKIKTIDLNEIDTIFVDNRKKGNNGKILVICSEGNAGFYEIGIMATPLALKYSVLGWNHPGFEGSTGKPFPEQDKNAIEGVLQFAIHKLNFAVEDIILYGWSIGGFSTIWGASCFPRVKGVIMDATFDDILHLAQPRMPYSLAGVVKIAIRQYCNLNISDLIPYYNGPILLIRRTEDEIITEDGSIGTNRGNYLALNILKYRYPYIFQAPQLRRIKNILSKPVEDTNMITTHDNTCLSRLITYVTENGNLYPMLIGIDYTDEERTQMAEFLLHKHFRDYKSTHCTPLPEDYFNIPWDLLIENEIVST